MWSRICRRFSINSYVLTISSSVIFILSCVWLLALECMLFHMLIMISPFSSGRLSWEQVLKYARLRKKYISLYASLLKSDTSQVVVDDNEEIEELDRGLDIELILQWRYNFLYTFCNYYSLNCKIYTTISLFVFEYCSMWNWRKRTSLMQFYVDVIWDRYVVMCCSLHCEQETLHNLFVLQDVGS